MANLQAEQEVVIRPLCNRTTRGIAHLPALLGVVRALRWVLPKVHLSAYFGNGPCQYLIVQYNSEARSRKHAWSQEPGNCTCGGW